MFNLQIALQNLGQPNEGLEKICYAPVTRAGQKATLDDCVIQSLFGYFQNDFEDFLSNETDDNGFYVTYLDTMNTCLL